MRSVSLARRSVDNVFENPEPYVRNRCTYIALAEDKKLIPLLRTNLAFITLNECVKVTALVDSGTCVSK